MRRLALAVLMLGLLGGCSSSNNNGGGGGPAVCNNFMACGGNIVGTWNVTNACGPGTTFTQKGFLMGCDASSITATITGASGMLTFNADMSYMTSLTQTLNSMATIPKSCLTAGASCSALETALKQQMGVTSATCTDDGTNCNCAIGQTATPMESGTYTTSGSMLTTTATGGTAQSVQYCVSGNQVSFSAPSDSTNPASPALVLVATK
jgi:hypothetical protein